jgi:hypothetical protein
MQRWVFGLAAVLATLIHCPPVRGSFLSVPTFVWSTNVNNQTFNYSASVRDSVFFAGNFTDGSGSLAAISGTTGGFTGPNSAPTFSDTYKMEANASTLEAKILNSTSSAGQASSFVNTGTGATKWYVLTGGAPGSTVYLQADFVFQGDLVGATTTAGGSTDIADARAFFTHDVRFLPNPGSGVGTFPLVINGSVLPSGQSPGSFSLVGTFQDQNFTSDNTIHYINYVIRSNPFPVRIGTPFALQFILNAAATTVTGPNAGDVAGAESNFFDPGLATSAMFPTLPQLTPDGFVVSLDGNPSTHDVATLSSQGLQLSSPAPEPASITLLCVGTVGMIGYGWRRRHIAQGVSSLPKSWPHQS